MSFVGVAIGGSVLGAGVNAYSANRAAKGQAQAAAASNALQKKMYKQQRKDQEPWREAGKQALSGLTGNADFQRDFAASDFEADPGYAFRMAEGQKALERSAAARGGLQSGGTLKALTKYGQDVASQEYGNAYNRFNADRDRRFNRLSSIAGVGQTANSQVAAAGQNYANQYGNNVQGAANANAAAGIAMGNAIGGGLSNIGNIGMQQNWMNQWKSNQSTPMAGQSNFNVGGIA
jgi:hypothetical protein